MIGNPYLPMGPRFRSRWEYRCVQATTIPGDGAYTVRTKYEYDTELKIVKETNVMMKPIIPAGPPIIRLTQEKDAYGIIITEYKPGQQPRYLVSYEWQDGKPWRVTVGNTNGGKTIYVVGHHDRFPQKHGRPVQISSVLHNGNLEHELNIEYDQFGHEISIHRWTHRVNEFLLSCKRNLEYDEHGHVVKIMAKEPHRLTQTYTFARTYNAKGYCTQARCLDADGKVLYKYRYLYQRFKLPKDKPDWSR